MHKYHLSKNSYVHSFKYLTLKTTKHPARVSCSNNLKLKLWMQNHIIIHHSIHNLNGKMRNVFSSFTGKVTAGHVSRVSYSMWNQLLHYSLKSTGLFQHNEIAIPPPRLNFVYVLTVSSTVKLISVDRCAVFLVCCYT